MALDEQRREELLGRGGLSDDDAAYLLDETGGSVANAGHVAKTTAVAGQAASSEGTSPGALAREPRMALAHERATPSDTNAARP